MSYRPLTRRTRRIRVPFQRVSNKEPSAKGRPDVPNVNVTYAEMQAAAALRQ